MIIYVLYVGVSQTHTHTERERERVLMCFAFSLTHPGSNPLMVLRKCPTIPNVPHQDHADDAGLKANQVLTQG